MPTSVDYEPLLIESLRKDKDLCLAYLTESIIEALEENNIKLLDLALKDIFKSGNVDVIENFADYLEQAEWIKQINQETLEKIQRVSLTSLLNSY